MSKKQLTLGFLALVLIGGMALSQVFAFEGNGVHGSSGSCKMHGGGGMHGHHGWGTAGKFFYKAHALLKSEKELQLSADQVKTIEGLKTETKKTLIRNKAEIETLKVDLDSQLHADKIDTAAASKLIDQKYELKKQSAKTLLEAYAKLKSTISAEQWETFHALKKEHRGKKSEAVSSEKASS